MKPKRKINIWRLIWVVGIFAILIVILLMVIDYKVNYEYLHKNYIYFYNCDDDLCSSFVNSGFNSNELYSIYECDYEDCPVLDRELGSDYIILTKDEKKILFDYKNGNIVADIYENYNLINDRYFIVSLNGYSGIIDFEGNILVKVNYDGLGYYRDDNLVGYNAINIIAKKKNLYGIISIKSEEIVEEFKYEEKDINNLIELINS